MDIVVLFLFKSYFVGKSLKSKEDIFKLLMGLLSS